MRLKRFCFDPLSDLVLGHDRGFSLFRCGVALDAWMFPLEDETFPGVKQPLFFINSEKFQWAGNISRMRKLDSPVTQRKMITIRYRRRTRPPPVTRV